MDGGELRWQRRHGQAAIVERGDPPVRVREQRQCLRHPIQGGGQLGQRLAQGSTAGEQIGHDLALVGRRPLVVATVGKHLLSELAPQQRPGQLRPPRRLRAGEARAAPGQCPDVLDEVIPAQIRLEMMLEIAQLHR